MVRRVRKSRRVCNKESLRNCKDLRACNKPVTLQTIYKNNCKDRINPVGIFKRPESKVGFKFNQYGCFGY